MGVKPHIHYSRKVTCGSFQRLEQ